MSSKSAKVLDSGRHVVVDLKRKQPDRCTDRVTGATNVLFPLRSSQNLAKRMKLDGSNKYESCVFPSGKRLLKYYSNFKKSGILQRLLYYCNDEWNDFPQEVITFVNKDLLVGQPAMEVKVNGNNILLDFLHMRQLDMNTGRHQPIAWIDVSGKCFFPEIVNDYDEPSYQYKFAEGHDHLGADPQESQDINLHLEIKIHGLNDESSGESHPFVEQVQAHENAAVENSDDEINSCADVEVDEKCGDDKQMHENTNLADDPVHGSLNSDAVTELFLKAISFHTAKIVEIRHSMGIVMENLFEIFEKQVEITERYRGDANVQYAWLPCSRGAVSGILKYGVGHYEALNIKPLHGMGIHLIPANGTPIRFDFSTLATRKFCGCYLLCLKKLIMLD